MGNSLEGENIDPGVTPTIPIPVEGTVDVQVSEDRTVTVKDFSKFFDVDYLSSLLKENKN